MVGVVQTCANEGKLYKNAYEVMESLKIHLLPKHQIVSINRRDIEAMVELLSSALSEASGKRKNEIK